MSWSIGVAFATGALDVPALAAIPLCAEIMARARDGQPPPEWWWFDPPPYEGDPNSTAAREQYRTAVAEHLAAEADAHVRAESLIHEIRYGADPRKARALRRAELKKGFDPSWLL